MRSQFGSKALTRIKLCFALYLTLSSLVANATDREIYAELLKLTYEEISSENNHCDMKDEPLTVGKFLSGYFEYVNSSPERLSTDFYCTDTITDKNCSFSYGQKPRWLGQEEWQRALRFKYHFPSKKIDKKSFSCIDIP